MSPGACRVPETVSDTGPVLHLQEIARLSALNTVAPLLLPDLVVEELARHGVTAARLLEAGIDFTAREIEPLAWRQVLRDIAPEVQPADAQVFSLARESGFRSLVLTDDLALRRLLESHGSPVTGTVGILIRAYTGQILSRDEVELAFDALFRTSTLHLGRAFRAYLRSLLDDLP
jgi:predicted nucleic acid-binding protein